MEYVKLQRTELDAEEEVWKKEFEPLRKPIKRNSIRGVLVSCLITSLLFVVFLGLFQPLILPLLESTFRIGTLCKSPVTRKEWRDQSPEEMMNYVSAVRCLSSKPSKLNSLQNDTLYDDFAFVHVRLHPKFHKGVLFLAWHRYFVHVYESTLKSECGLKHNIPYWDWTLDWEDPARAPVFSGETGFGGDGNPTVKAAAGNGYCVTNGGLADIKLKYFGLEVAPHCLSRSFADGGQPPTAGRLSGQKYTPEAMDELMQKQDSTSFAAKLDSIHTAIPIGIRGEMARFTSPYEPIFFLHHTQVDRIWWKWQQNHTEAGITENDILEMSGLVEDLRLLDIMRTKGPHLCYRY